MAALINTVIPPQQFELVRDRIALILGEELFNQQDLDNTFSAPTVYLERVHGFNISELPAVNVCLADADYSNTDVRSSDGEYVFYVDSYAAAASTTAADGDKRSAIAMHRVLGKCRAILKNPQYKTLAFPPPSLSRVTVSTIRNVTPDGTGDAVSLQVGRLEVRVQVPETVSLLPGVSLAISATQAFIDTTDEGYLYVAIPSGIYDEGDAPIVDEGGSPLIPETGGAAKISGFPGAGDITGQELLTGLQNGTNVNYSMAQLLAFVFANVPGGSNVPPFLPVVPNGTPTVGGIPPNATVVAIALAGRVYLMDEFTQIATEVTLANEVLFSRPALLFLLPNTSTEPETLTES